MNYAENLLLRKLIEQNLGNSGGTSSDPVSAAEEVVQILSTTPSIAAEDQKLYVCTDELDSLTITTLPAVGLFEIVFASGSTATEVTMPSNVLLPIAASIEANSIYDLSIRTCTVAGHTVGLAAIQGWTIPVEEEESE